MPEDQSGEPDPDARQRRRTPPAWRLYAPRGRPPSDETRGPDGPRGPEIVGRRRAPTVLSTKVVHQTALSVALLVVVAVLVYLTVQVL